ncbi:MAG: hypothetical protein J5654_01875 [Victivallales bacterium]|nr:hypothetical protein [Victivallales bacterium]
MKMNRFLFTGALSALLFVSILSSCGKNSSASGAAKPSSLELATQAFLEAANALTAKDFDKLGNFLPTDSKDNILAALKSNFMQVELGNIVSKEMNGDDVLIVCEAKMGKTSGVFDVPMKKVDGKWVISLAGLKPHIETSK